MKVIAVALLLVISLAASAEDMRAHLRQTQSLVHRGQHKEALDRMIWFHANALGQDPSMYTARLTVALDTWQQLASFYPPAEKALVGIRDRNESRIVDNGGSRQIFHDFVAINQALGEQERSLLVFQKLQSDHPERAREYWPLVKDVALRQRKLELASQYITDPTAEFESIRKAYQRQARGSLKRSGPKSEVSRAREERFVEEARPLIELAVITGDSDSALRIQKEALDLIDDPALQKQLTAGFPNPQEALPPAEDPPILEE